MDQRDSSGGPPNAKGNQELPSHRQKGSENGNSDRPETCNDGTSGMHSNQSPLKVAEQELEKVIPAANPLLPKIVHPEQRQPPQCPLKDIQFVQLQRFKRYKQALLKMEDGFDQIGKRGIQRELREKRRKNKFGEEEEEVKMDDTTVEIRNIVYARDPKIFDTKSGMVNQRAAFNHENMLDIKNLVAQQEAKSGSSNMRMPMSKPKVVKSMEERQKDKELEAKAKHKLATLEDGTIDRKDKTLLFESRFESGNLYLAQKVSDHEYNCLMQNDINTTGHTQWFFFQVKNTRKNHSVTFNITNFSKPDSLFNYGMKVAVYSDVMAQAEEDEEGNVIKDGVGWHKGGENFSYYANGIKKDPGQTWSKQYYTLSFTYKFQHDDDCVYFAFCYPYTYTDLMHDIYEIESDPARRAICVRKTLCKTLAGNDCDVLTITEKADFATMQQKKAVIISARVHPGEVVGSWMMRGVLNFLTNVEDKEAQMLRENFIFKVLPMLNPDGVINGNYRCSLAGCDLNRRWKTPHRLLHPTINATKRLIRDLHEERGVTLYCDLHGHSRKQNVFMYGCNNPKRPEECRVFPFMLSKLSSFFDFESCRFSVQKSKESTARVSLYKELRTCPNIFTMESTFSGIDFGDLKGCHMSTDHFEDMGLQLCRTLLIYCNIYCPPELEHLFPHMKQGQKGGDMAAAFASELKSNKKLLSAGEGDSSGGSDSEPSDDNLPAEELQKQVPVVEKPKPVPKKKPAKERHEDSERKKPELPKKKIDDSALRSNSPKERRVPKPQPEPFKLKPQETDKKDGKKKKEKVETRDACVQTERSDFKKIKAQWLEKQRREQVAMREHHARMANSQFKSNVGLVDAKDMNARKSLQSSTQGQRDGNGHPNERLVQDMRNQQYAYPQHRQKQGQSRPSAQNSIGQDLQISPNQVQSQLQASNVSTTRGSAHMAANMSGNKHGTLPANQAQYSTMSAQPFDMSPMKHGVDSRKMVNRNSNQQYNSQQSNQRRQVHDVPPSQESMDPSNPTSTMSKAGEQILGNSSAQKGSVFGNITNESQHRLSATSASVSKQPQPHFSPDKGPMGQQHIKPQDGYHSSASKIDSRGQSRSAKIMAGAQMQMKVPSAGQMQQQPNQHSRMHGQMQMVPNGSTGEIRKQDPGAGRYINNQRWGTGTGENSSNSGSQPMNNVPLFQNNAIRMHDGQSPHVTSPGQRGNRMQPGAQSFAMQGNQQKQMPQQRRQMLPMKPPSEGQVRNAQRSGQPLTQLLVPESNTSFQMGSESPMTNVSFKQNNVMIPQMMEDGMAGSQVQNARFDNSQLQSEGPNRRNNSGLQHHEMQGGFVRQQSLGQSVQQNSLNGQQMQQRSWVARFDVVPKTDRENLNMTGGQRSNESPRKNFSVVVGQPKYQNPRGVQDINAIMASQQSGVHTMNPSPAQHNNPNMNMAGHAPRRTSQPRLEISQQGFPMNNANFQQYVSGQNTISNATSPGVFNGRRLVPGQPGQKLGSPAPQQPMNQMSAQQRSEGIRISSQNLQRSGQQAKN